MNDRWLDALELDESELFDADHFGEFDDGDAESARSRAQARARARSRARQLASMRRRAAIQRATHRPTPTTPAGRLGQELQRNRAAIQEADLESKVRTDTLAGAVSADRRRIIGAEQAIAIDKVVDQARLYFPQIDKEELGRLLAPIVPLLLLRPEKRGEGLAAFMSDPRAWGPLAGAALLIYSKIRGGDQVAAVNLGPSLSVASANTTYQLTAILSDRSGKILPAKKLKWTSLSEKVAKVDSDTGLVSFVAPPATLPAQVTIIADDPDTGTRGAVTLTITA
jgi:hypothetical protein